MVLDMGAIHISESHLALPCTIVKKKKKIDSQISNYFIPDAASLT